MNNTLDKIIEKYMKPEYKKVLDDALDNLNSECLAEFEEAIELWKTYGGD